VTKLLQRLHDELCAAITPPRPERVISDREGVYTDEAAVDSTASAPTIPTVPSLSARRAKAGGGGPSSPRSPRSILLLRVLKRRKHERGPAVSRSGPETPPGRPQPGGSAAPDRVREPLSPHAAADAVWRGCAAARWPT